MASQAQGKAIDSHAEQQGLVVEAGESPGSLANRHRLLMEFRFGDPSPGREGGVINVPLPAIGAGASSERWWYPGGVEHDDSGFVRKSLSQDFLVLTVEVPHEDCRDVRSATREAYAQLLQSLAERPGFGFVRMWNYLGAINDGDADDERYRQFSIGRAEAFQASGIDDAGSPVGTGIGTPEGTGLIVTGLASRGRFVAVENPLQVSAFNYPRQYGPRSPKFSRSGILPTCDGALFLISGTAAVVGHESAHPFETAEQLEATLQNLDSLVEAASKHGDGALRWGLDGESCLRVYLRRPEDLEIVRDVLTGARGIPESRLVFLQGDICRRELMIEIEACVVV